MIYELRQYTLVPGGRDALVALFDAEFVEGQERSGMVVVGQFTEPDRADRFVWLRGFADMAARQRALSNFYGGPVWQEHKDAANATMVDWHDVLLLEPVDVTSDFAPPGPPGGATGAQMAVLIADWTVATSDDVPGTASMLRRRFESAAAEVLALLKTHTGRNDFPQLPVREGENHLVAVVRTADGGEAELADVLGGMVPTEPVLLRLQPTPRSRLR